MFQDVQAEQQVVSLRLQPVEVLLNRALQKTVNSCTRDGGGW